MSVSRPPAHASLFGTRYFLRAFPVLMRYRATEVYQVGPSFEANREDRQSVSIFSADHCGWNVGTHPVLRADGREPWIIVS